MRDSIDSRRSDARNVSLEEFDRRLLDSVSDVTLCLTDGTTLEGLAFKTDDDDLNHFSFFAVNALASRSIHIDQVKTFEVDGTLWAIERPHSIQGEKLREPPPRLPQRERLSDHDNLLGDAKRAALEPVFTTLLNPGDTISFRTSQSEEDFIGVFLAYDQANQRAVITSHDMKELCCIPLARIEEVLEVIETGETFEFTTDLKQAAKYKLIEAQEQANERFQQVEAEFANWVRINSDPDHQIEVKQIFAHSGAQSGYLTEYDTTSHQGKFRTGTGVLDFELKLIGDEPTLVEMSESGQGREALHTSFGNVYHDQIRKVIESAYKKKECEKAITTIPPMALPVEVLRKIVKDYPELVDKLLFDYKGSLNGYSLDDERSEAVLSSDYHYRHHKPPLQEEETLSLLEGDRSAQRAFLLVKSGIHLTDNALFNVIKKSLAGAAAILGFRRQSAHDQGTITREIANRFALPEKSISILHRPLEKPGHFPKGAFSETTLGLEQIVRLARGIPRTEEDLEE